MFRRRSARTASMVSVDEEYVIVLLRYRTFLVTCGWRRLYLGNELHKVTSSDEK